MTIAKKARARYLNRKFRNYDRVKNYEEPRINGYLKQIEPKPKFFTRPMLHQKVAFLIGAYMPYWLFFFEPGTGKSKIALDLITHWMNKGRIKKTLVLVPNVVNIESWTDEVSLHSPGLKFQPLLGSTKERKELIKQGDADVYAVNYQGLVYLATTAPKVKKGKRIIDKAAINWLKSTFDGLILDESHICKSWNTTTYKILNLMADSCKVRYALTGTPFGRDPQDLWSQFKLIDRGETFGENLTMFRYVFFNQKINYWGGYEYNFKKIMENKLHHMVKNRALRYSADECLDLPERVDHQIFVHFPEGAENYYKTVIKEIIDATKGKKKKANPFIQLRQISSGFINIGSSDEKQYVDFPDNPKLEALIGFIEGLPETEKVVVFNEFIHSGDRICAELKKLKIGYERLYSGTRDHVKAIRNFKNKPDCRVFVVNSASGGTGTNLQVARYALFYESPVSPIVRKQAEKRVYRQGQDRKTFIYDFITRGTADQKILEYIKQGDNLFDAILEGRASIL